jgi:REP element-mobilizing transposase RayT
VAQTYTRLLFHLVFSTKNREPLIEDAWRPELHSYIGGILRNRKADLLAAGGIPDHMHLLVRSPADWAVSDLVRDIKAVSSRWRRDLGDRGFAWQNGYGAFTVSASMAATVTDYINNQPEHHRKQSFREEFVEFLRRHGIEYDEKYLWA